MKAVTTSWDDGNEADFRIAELLDKFNLKGTFYVPQRNREKPVMASRRISELSKVFEIGGHTLNHIRLNKVDDATIASEVFGSFQWLTEITGAVPVSFSFPGGVYDNRVLRAAFKSGYKLLRGTELLNINQYHSLKIVGTTLQLYPHNQLTYLGHLCKRGQWKNFFQWLASSATSDIEKLTEFYLKRIELKGGCFHLWGHSWEIEENQLWHKLEAVFRILSNRSGFTYIENRDLVSLA